MAQIILFEDAVRIVGEHNDTPIGSVEDEWGTHPVYEINKVYWYNLKATIQNIVVEDENGKKFTYTMAPLETGSRNLATPVRFASYPLAVHCTLVR